MFIKNYWFIAALVACTGFSLYAMIDPAEVIKNWLELTVMPPMDFRLIILAFSIAQVTGNAFYSMARYHHVTIVLNLQIVCCLLAEEFLVDRLLVKLMDSKFWLHWRPRKEKYLAVERQLKEINWPDLIH